MILPGIQFIFSIANALRMFTVEILCDYQDSFNAIKNSLEISMLKESAGEFGQICWSLVIIALVYLIIMFILVKRRKIKPMVYIITSIAVSFVLALFSDTIESMHNGLMKLIFDINIQRPEITSKDLLGVSTDTLYFIDIALVLHFLNLKWFLQYYGSCLGEVILNKKLPTCPNQNEE